MDEMKSLPWSELGAHFTDEDKSREYMEFLRWGNAGPCARSAAAIAPTGCEVRRGPRRVRAC
jgi:hypothetical protein